MTDASVLQLIPKAHSTTATTAPSVGLSERHEKILEARGLEPDLLAKLNWRTGRNGFIEIPFYRNGVEVNHKGRTIEGEKKFYQKEGCDKCLYNLDILKEIGEADLIITEGEMDCVIALQCGFMAVSVPDGAPAQQVGDRSSVKYDYLADVPKTINRIILAVDSDNPGLNLMHDLALRLGEHRCLWVTYPEGCKDLNDTYLKYGKEAATKVIHQARFYTINGLYTLDELPPMPKMEAHHIGIAGMDDNLKLRRGDFSVVTGIPSHGKSTFINHVAFNMAKNHGWNVCFASFEQPPQTEHRDSLTALYNERPAYCQEPTERARADKWINENCCFIAPGDNMDTDFDLEWLMKAMLGAVVRYNSRLIVIDPWNELDHIYDQRETSATQYTGYAIKALKRFAKAHMVHVMVIAHPTKLKKDQDGVYPVPTAYDIADSSHWYNKPEQVIVVHREQNGNTLIRVAKSRYHYALGKPGDIELKYDDYSHKFSFVKKL